jgi:hypothetical protein
MSRLIINHSKRRHAKENEERPRRFLPKSCSLTRWSKQEKTKLSLGFLLFSCVSLVPLSAVFCALCLCWLQQAAAKAEENVLVCCVLLSGLHSQSESRKGKERQIRTKEGDETGTERHRHGHGYTKFVKNIIKKRLHRRGGLSGQNQLAPTANGELFCRGVSNSSRTKLFANFSEKARVRQVRTFFLSSRTVRGVCLPIIPLHNKQYNV